MSSITPYSSPESSPARSAPSSPVSPNTRQALVHFSTILRGAVNSGNTDDFQHAFQAWQNLESMQCNLPLSIRSIFNSFVGEGHDFSQLNTSCQEMALQIIQVCDQVISESSTVQRSARRILFSDQF